MLDLGVWFDEKLLFSEHIQTKINKANMMLGIIKRNFKHLTALTFLLLHTSMVRSHLEYCYSLPNWVVSANITNTFKGRFDKFWHNQYIVYDFRAQLHGTGQDRWETYISFIGCAVCSVMF